jgi:hypothetical protein
LREEIKRQGLSVPDSFRFLHPSFVAPYMAGVCVVTDFHVITEPQEQIISTRDFADNNIILFPIPSNTRGERKTFIIITEKQIAQILQSLLLLC